MKKIIFIILLKVLIQQVSFGQKQVVKKWIIPKKTYISVLNKYSVMNTETLLLKPNIAAIPETAPLLSFNGQPILHTKKSARIPILFFAELSFNDMLQDRLNSLKPDLINTYDDDIAELFKDAPSLIKISCVIYMKSILF